jgi:basic membrane lipoprotein Med (substrate-binding protein (PBP1-ABC) superfamily)
VTSRTRPTARPPTENFISQGADIILPVAGPVGLGAAAAAEAADGVNLIWVDSDGFESASQYGALFISSVLKNIDAAVFTTTQETLDGTFSNEPYVGTLENGGVGLAPFHDFEDTVPQELKDELTAIQEGIIAGDITWSRRRPRDARQPLTAPAGGAPTGASPAVRSAHHEHDRRQANTRRWR